MPTLRQKPSSSGMQINRDLKDMMTRVQNGEGDYYWEPDPAPSVASASTYAVTNNSLKPDDKLDLVRKKKRRGLTIQRDGEATNLLASIGLNIPS